ncbi:DNA recombination protein RmuC, partial [bacterium]|nr:DNA recombination protein RmuC [bacterium]
METILLVVVVAAVSVLAGGFFASRIGGRRTAENDLRAAIQQSRDELQRNLSELRTQMSNELTTGRTEQRDALQKTSSALEEKFEKLQTANEQKLTQIQGKMELTLTQTLDRTGKTFKQVTDALSELHATNEKIFEFSRDLNKLSDILQSPKLRGEFGELQLERMLSECLAPEQYALQYSIGNEKADVVILSSQGHLPVDSKFPLENWRKANDVELPAEERDKALRVFGKDVRKHIDDIANKYIRPPVTLNFAVMFIPADSIHYELLRQPDILQHARERRVFPASPTTFWALLQVTVIGFRGMKISEEAQKIAGLLDGLRKDLDKFRDAFQKAYKQ